jgi:hypothetical protein
VDRENGRVFREIPGKFEINQKIWKFPKNRIFFENFPGNSMEKPIEKFLTNTLSENSQPTSSNRREKKKLKNGVKIKTTEKLHYFSYEFSGSK